MKTSLIASVAALTVIAVGLSSIGTQAIDLSILGERVFDGRPVSPSEGFGTKIAVGDVDDDGIDDLVVGAPFADDKLNAGRVYIWLGPVSEAPTPYASADIVILGAASPDQLGSAVAIGDLDGDEVNELAIGAPETSPQGSVFILKGPTTGIATGTRFIDLADATTYAARIIGGHFSGGPNGDNTGEGLAIAELTGDTFPDLAIGASGPDVNGEDSGAVYIVAGDGSLGSLNGLDLSMTPPASVILGPSFKGIFGRGLAAGDLDDDGQSDIAVGAQDAIRTGTRLGETYIVQGPFTGTVDLSLYPAEPKILLQIDGVDSEDIAGTGIAIGDLDYDGRPDLVIGASHADSSGTDAAGEVHFISDPLGGLLSDPHQLTTATREFVGDPGDAAGSGVAVGDINHDGRLDLAIGSPSIIDNPGKVTVFFDDTPVPTPTPGPPFDPPGPPENPGPPATPGPPENPGPPIDPPGRGR